MFLKSLLPLSFFLFLASCSPTQGTTAQSPFGQPGPSGTQNPNGANRGLSVQNLAPDTCLTQAKGARTLDDGSKAIPSYPLRATFGQDDQDIYVAGTFPEHYKINDDPTPEEKKQLEKGTTFRWDINTDQEFGGDGSKLVVFKFVLNPADNQAYTVMQKTFNYGDSILINDNDAGLVIQCNYPAAQ